MDDFEPFWKQWIPRKRHPWTNRRTFDVRKRKGCAPFYVVKYGREPGMFYRWLDCRRSRRLYSLAWMTSMGWEILPG